MPDENHTTCGCPHGQQCAAMPSREQPATINDLTLEQLTDLVSAASGWSDHASIAFRRNVDRSSAPHRFYVAVSVEICGGKATVSAGGTDHRSALIALLQNIEMHHHENLRWHKQRCAMARKILDAHDVYYIKSGL